jgi:hypothetical protein
MTDDEVQTVLAAAKGKNCPTIARLIATPQDTTFSGWARKHSLLAACQLNDGVGTVATNPQQPPHLSVPVLLAASQSVMKSELSYQQAKVRTVSQKLHQQPQFQRLGMPAFAARSLPISR